MGLVVSHVGHNQLASYLLYGGNEFYRNANVGDDLIVFYQNLAKPQTLPVFPLMNISELYSYDGVGVATSLETATKLLHAPGPSSRYFYLWDLEWLHGEPQPFDTLLSIYSNPRLQFIARNSQHAAEFTRCWNRPVKAVIANCDLKALMEVVSNPK